MKKITVKSVLLLLQICFVLCISVAAAEIEENDRTSILKSRDEVIENIHVLFSEEEFGGIYLEGDTLVINIAGNEGAVNANKVADRISNSVAVEYRMVEHPLRDLENVKDYLAQYMTKYNISALDANEVTNQVDVYLLDYCDSVIDKIKCLVEDQFNDNIIVNFIDKSGTEIRYTVADVASNENTDNQEQNDSTRVVTNSGAKKLRAVLVFDRQKDSSISAATDLDDIDLYLRKNGSSDNCTGATSSRNNVEIIEYTIPSSGYYTFFVKGFRIVDQANAPQIAIAYRLS